ncbi:SNF2-related protein [Endozoicomonas sp. ALC066]|uniref:SNF2-related protein n=1 Tax=Endozoicomonas sp. ALC066 TaxID=3403078 RepID=UPI003BB65BC3
MTYTLDDYFKDSGVKLTIPFAPYITMKFKPRPDQVKALNQSVYYMRYLNASDPGTGKTVSAQAWGLYWISEGTRVLVVMPPALLYQFQQSFFDTYKGLDKYVSCHVLDEAPAKRQKLMDGWDKDSSWPEFLLLSYHKLRSMAPRLRKAGYEALMADEAHALKNPESMIHKVVHDYVGGWNDSAFLAMTGTPVVNELLDAYGLVKMCNPEAYATLREFERAHCLYEKIRLKKPKKLRNGGMLRHFKKLVGYRDVDTIHKHMYRHGMRVLKEDVLSLHEPVITEVAVKLSTKHLNLYRKLAKERILEIGDELITAIQEQGLRQKLLQIVTCPHLFIPPEEKIENGIFKTTEALLDSVGIQSTKVVIFANYQQTVEQLAEHFHELNPAIIYGASKNANAERIKFIENDACRLLIANPVSAGAGLDGLQTVSHNMIFVEPTGVPGQFSQCVARLQRGGQKKPVSIYVLKALSTVAPKATKEMLRKAENVKQVNMDRESLMDYFQIAS